jgi:hypothetical protein
VAQALDAAVDERRGRCGADRLPGEVLGGQPLSQSINSVDGVVKATTHKSLIDDEAKSAVDSTAVQDLVASVRTPNPSPRAYRGDRHTRLLGHTAPAVGMSQRAPAPADARTGAVNHSVGGRARRAGT